MLASVLVSLNHVKLAYPKVRSWFVHAFQESRRSDVSNLLRGLKHTSRLLTYENISRPLEHICWKQIVNQFWPTVLHCIKWKRVQLGLLYVNRYLLACRSNVVGRFQQAHDHLLRSLTIDANYYMYKPGLDK